MPVYTVIFYAKLNIRNVYIKFHAVSKDFFIMIYRIRKNLFNVIINSLFSK